MLSNFLSNYRSVAGLIFVVLGVALVELFEVRASVYPSLLPFFEWLKYSSWIGYLGITFGSVYATVQAVHLISMAIIGGTVLVTDLRLLGVLLKDIPSETITKGTHQCFKYSLSVAIATGIFCAAGVADKVYYMPVFWIKMLALLVGSCFMFFIKQPLLNSRSHSEIDPWILRILAVASITIWFTVAATGRWIGFS
ncbi:MAG: hypothetical protein QMC06_06920 [Gammaproteobacteria bacterium]|jgi:hypothetical protein